MSKLKTVAAVVAALVLVAVAGYAFQWRYEHVPSGEQTVLVRINRFTDRTEVFAHGLWLDRDAALRRSSAEIAKNPDAPLPKCEKVGESDKSPALVEAVNALGCTP